MHELALADAVVKAALRSAEDSGMERVLRIVVKVGELQQIEKDLFEFSLTNVVPLQDPRLGGVVFDVQEEPVRFGCRTCQHEYGRADINVEDPDATEAIHFIPELAHAYARCPNCSSPDFDIIAGRGITLASMEGSGNVEP